jgi:hypothetical protein
MLLMTDLLDKYAREGMLVLDVGSYNVNGDYRELCESRGLQYQGLDIAAGPNVDIVAESPYIWPVDSNTYNMVISGQCLEHVEMPWLWARELYRVCKPGGLAIIIAPGLNWGIHRHPVDCWRVLPDGMRALLINWAGFSEKVIGIKGVATKPNCDCFGVVRKPG